MVHTLCDPPEDVLIVRMLDDDAFGAVLGYIGYGARLAVWLTCKAFNARRPVGKFTTSVRAMCATPAMLDWAIVTGLQPHHMHMSPPAAHLVLKAIGGFGTASLAPFGVTVRRMLTHIDDDVKLHAAKTASLLLMELFALEPVALLEPGALATYIGFILEMLIQEHDYYKVTDNAEWVLETIICRLGKLEAHVLLAGVIGENLSHSNMHVRHGTLNALNALDKKALGQYTDTIVRFMLDAGVQGGDAWARNRALEVLCNLEPGVLRNLEPVVLSAFVSLVVELLWNPDYLVRGDALRVLGRLEQTVLAPHEVTVTRKLADPDVDLRTTAVKALGMFNQVVIAQHAGEIVGSLKDADSSMRYYATETLGKLAAVDLARYADDVAEMLGDTWVQRAAVETLGMLSSADLGRHAGAVAQLLECKSWFVRQEALRTLEKLSVVDLEPHAGAVARMLRCGNLAHRDDGRPFGQYDPLLRLAHALLYRIHCKNGV